MGIEVAHLTVSYGENVALDDVSCRIPAGEITGLIGMNGSGKSTLFKSMMGLVRPDRGTVLIDGRTPTEARSSARVGYVPQNEQVDWTFPINVEEVVMMGRYGQMGPMRRPRRSDREAVGDALAKVDLTDYARRQIGQLSGGQKKRVFVARGIAQGADVLLLDEPFAGVDKRSEQTITRLLRSLAAKGTTVVVSTHDLHGLPGRADSAIVLARRIIFQGDVTEALRPERIVQAFGVDVMEGQD